MNARIAAAVMAIVATLDGAAVWAQQPPVQGDLVGGNFWDMRATGRRLGIPMTPARAPRAGPRPSPPTT